MIRTALALAAALAALPALAGSKGSESTATAPPAAGAVAARTVEIKVTEGGFEPREIKLKKGEPATLVFTRKTDRTCITAIDIPDEQVKKLELPLNKPVAVTITPKKAGTEKFHCSAMAMGNGRIVVE